MKKKKKKKQSLKTHHDKTVLEAKKRKNVCGGFPKSFFGF